MSDIETLQIALRDARREMEELRAELLKERDKVERLEQEQLDCEHNYQHVDRELERVTAEAAAMREAWPVVCTKCGYHVAGPPPR